MRLPKALQQLSVHISWWFPYLSQVSEHGLALPRSAPPTLVKASATRQRSPSDSLVGQATPPLRFRGTRQAPWKGCPLDDGFAGRVRAELVLIRSNPQWMDEDLGEKATSCGSRSSPPGHCIQEDINAAPTGAYVTE